MFVTKNGLKEQSLTIIQKYNFDTSISQIFSNTVILIVVIDGGMCTFKVSSFLVVAAVAFERIKMYFIQLK